MSSATDLIKYTKCLTNQTSTNNRRTFHQSNQHSAVDNYSADLAISWFIQFYWETRWQNISP